MYDTEDQEADESLPTSGFRGEEKMCPDRRKSSGDDEDAYEDEYVSSSEDDDDMSSAK